MSERGRARLLALGLVVLATGVGCASPEATRTRGGGPGADPGNRGATVRMHEGSQPYYETPHLTGIASPPLEPASQARAAEHPRR